MKSRRNPDILYAVVTRATIEIKSDVSWLVIFCVYRYQHLPTLPLVCAFISLARIPRGVRKPFKLHACMYITDVYTSIGAQTRVWKRPVRACTRGCVGACNAREMRRTTIQILLLLLREQSPVNRPPRHNVSIQVRSAVLNRSGSTLRESRKSFSRAGKIILRSVFQKFVICATKVCSKYILLRLIYFPLYA